MGGWRAREDSQQLSPDARRPSDASRIGDEWSGDGLSSFDSEDSAENAARRGIPSSRTSDPRPENQPRTRVLFAAALLTCLVITGVLVMRFARNSENSAGETATSESSVQRPQGATSPTDVRPQPATAPAVRPAPAASDAGTRERTTVSHDAQTRSKTATSPRAGQPSGVAARTTPGPSATVARSAPPPPPSSVDPLPAPSPLNPEALPAPALATAVPTTGVLNKESVALDEMLSRYEQAYDRLDAQAVASIWPSVDARALSRAFARLREQNLELGSCRFAISENAATAHCSGHLRYAQRVGDTSLKSERHVWTIRFAGAGDVWRIVGVSAQ